jgi:hypothetical protein
MESKINTKKRIQIHVTDLWPIKREYYDDEAWFNVFVKKFSDDSGIEKTSVRSTRTRKMVYYFKIVDKHKWLLAKIKYGI